jgi:hypothetical protein
VVCLCLQLGAQRRLGHAPLGTRALAVIPCIRAAGIGGRCVDRQVVPVFGGVESNPKFEIRDAIIDSIVFELKRVIRYLLLDS